MTWLQFIADIFRSLVSVAWPAAFVIAFWLFREKLTELMPLLRLKYKDLDVSFHIQQAQKDAEALPKGPAAQPTQEETDRFKQLVAISPSSAIAQKSRELEQALADFAEASMGSIPKPPSLLTMTRELRKAELVDGNTVKLIHELNAIRNSAVHGGNRKAITEKDANDFATLADRLIGSLQITRVAALANLAPAPLGPAGP